MRTIIRMLHEAAERFPTRAYTTKKTEEGWKAYSYCEVDNESDRIAAYFIAKGLKSASAFGILAEGRPEWVMAEIGVIKARGISVPLSIKLKPEEIAFRLIHSEAKGIIASSNTLDNVCKALDTMESKPILYYLDSLDDRLIRQQEAHGWKEGEDFVTWDALIGEGDEILQRLPTIVDKVVEQIDENDTVNICYTSGTTGNPKGIMLTHLNYWANSNDAVKLFKLPDAEFETLVVLPVDHSFAHTVGIYTSMLRGITLHFVDARGSNAAIIRNFPKNLVEVSPVFLMTVPSISGSFMKKMTQGVAEKGPFINGIFQRGLKAGIKRNGDGFNRPSLGVQLATFFPYKLASLLVFPKLRKVFGDRIKYCVGGGALLEARQQHFFAAIGVPVYQGYGLTEAAPIISSNSPERYKFGTSGMVAPSVTCRIMKSETEEAKVGERGEIVIKGENVMKGYFKNPKATAEVLREENGETWLWTGDLGYYDEDGFLVVTGRAKALLIAKDGEKYSPEEVEEVMINHTEVLNQLVVYNDHRAFTSALVTLQEDVVRRLIADEQLDTPEAVLRRLNDVVRSYEPIAASSIPSQWIPGRFAFIAEAFSEADGLVNSTMKLVRYKVFEFYKTRIDELYESEQLNEQRNLEVVKQLFFS
ncbi:AMP-dependent synthetase/ligase [Pleomorphochaeta sp. DL1XJH-081]|uniref:AMP-dependent synthetase/ligase n=1 Tax=Pleomorphochaeta sp. DL1XJH-081 TaxID=3409690 RepID=UPI003BB5E300